MFSMSDQIFTQILFFTKTGFCDKYTIPSQATVVLLPDFRELLDIINLHLDRSKFQD
jgi:hypothetical protein